MLAIRSALGLFACSVVVALFACVGEDPASSSSGGPANDGGGSSSGDSGGGGSTCAAPRATCGSACVDLQSDDSHCGACDAKCPGTKCSNGVCDGARVKQIASGGSAACAVRIDGSVFCWGNGESAALGQRFEGNAGVPCDKSTTRCQPAPMKVPSLEPVESVSAGFLHACAVTKKGEVWCWGRNVFGEVGPLNASASCDGVSCIDKPTRIEGLTGVVQVGIGLGHACARTNVGEVFCWGDGARGRLGNGSTDPSETPVKVVGVTGATDLSVSPDHVGHACVVVTNSDVWCWGANVGGALGRSNLDDGLTAAKADSTGVTGIKKVATGAAHTCVLTHGGTVHCWGYEQYGVGTASATARQVTTDAKAFSADYIHGCAIKTNGTVECWGISAHGRLGFLPGADSPPCAPGGTWPCSPGAVPVTGIGQAASIDVFTASIVLRDDGKVFAWGPNGSALLGVAPSAGPKQCSDFADGGASTPCTDAPTEIVFP